jgi:hypothetical protein
MTKIIVQSLKHSGRGVSQRLMREIGGSAPGGGQ